MEVTVRKATANDYNDICELFNEIDALHYDNLPRVFQKPSGPAREQEYYLGLIADNKVGFFVANADEKLVSFVHAVFRDTPAIPVFVPNRYVNVDSIVVKSEYQKRGIGSILLDKVQEWAMEKDALSIELNVYEFNQTAISFYENLGYRSISRKMSKDLKMDDTRST